MKKIRNSEVCESTNITEFDKIKNKLEKKFTSIKIISFFFILVFLITIANFILALKIPNDLNKYGEQIYNKVNDTQLEYSLNSFEKSDQINREVNSLESFLRLIMFLNLNLIFIFIIFFIKILILYIFKESTNKKLKKNPFYEMIDKHFSS